MGKKYAFNPGRGTVHLIGKCRETKKRVPQEYVCYMTYESLIK